MRIFISHASQDRDLTEAIVELLRLGTDLQRQQVFFSSGIGTGIPPGLDFIDYIRDQLNNTALVVALMTPAFFRSPFCLCELGAVLFSDTPSFPILVPPATPEEAAKVLGSTQLEFLREDGRALDRLRDRIADLSVTSETASWNQHRARFLDRLPALQRQLVDRESADSTGQSIESAGQEEHLRRALHALQTGLPIYESNHSEITLDPTLSSYEVRTRKVVRNAHPVSIQFFVQSFICNKYPSDPEQSLSYYLQNPIRWADLSVWARDHEGRLDIRLLNDFNNRKDFIIYMERRKIPRHIGPRETREIEYGYTVPSRLWGNYFERPVRKPTARISVAVALPLPLRNVTVGLWSLSATAPKQALPEIQCQESVDETHRHYAYEIDNPLLGHSYQVVWSYEGQDVDDSTQRAVVPESPTS